MTCDRKGCDKKATAQVVSDYGEARPTRACEDHAQWWTKGINGARIGTIVRSKP